MELLSPAWWSSLLAIVLIDLVLAGDNAIVIALVARKLPSQLRIRAIVWGTIGAVVVRALMTIGVVWLLRIPGVMLIGGLALLVVAVQLLTDTDGPGADQPAATTLRGAMKTIIVADALMGMDNVLGVAGAAHGSIELVVIGLLISIPIMTFGSRLVLRLVDRFPMMIYLGAAVLAYTAARMVVDEPFLVRDFFAAHRQWIWPVVGATVALVLLIGALIRRARAAGGSPSAAGDDGSGE